MKKVIGGKLYNTETATKIAVISKRDHNFSDHTTRLYITKKGNFFLQGKGGPMSRWAEPCGQSGWSGGEGLVEVSKNEALEFAENANLDPDEMIEAGFKIREA